VARPAAAPREESLSPGYEVPVTQPRSRERVER
jgi:hypothetical protein